MFWTNDWSQHGCLLAVARKGIEPRRSKTLPRLAATLIHGIKKAAESDMIRPLADEAPLGPLWIPGGFL